MGVCVGRLSAMLAALVIGLHLSPTHAGELDAARSVVRTPRTDEPAQPSCGCDDDAGLGKFLWDITFGTLAECLWGGHWDSTTDGCGNVQYTRWYWIPVFATQFAPYPYSDDVSGIVVGPEDSIGSTNRCSARLAIDYGNDFDDLERFGGSALIEWRAGFGLDAETAWYREKTSAGRDDLAVGDVNLLWRMVETKHTIWRAGVGLNWLGDDARADFGANFTLRTDLYPIRPVILSGQLDVGTLGNAGQFHGRVAAGVNIRRYEVFIGYDYRAVGNAELAGPLAGLQFWF